MDESLPKRCASHSGENEFSGSKVISPTQATPITVYKKVNCNESYSAATTNCHYINGNALHHNKLIMAILTDQLPFSTENLDGRRETNMYLFPSIHSPLGVLSHSHPMWNISTWQVAKLWPGYLLHSKASHCNQHRRGHCAWCPWDYVIMMSLFGLYCACAKESLSLFLMQHEVVQWLLSNPL